MSSTENGWKAVENRQPTVGGGPTLRVTGTVETSNTNQTPKLTEAIPQGFSPHILILILEITASGVGNPVMGKENVEFTKAVTPGQHSSVEVRQNGAPIANIRVEVIQ